MNPDDIELSSMAKSFEYEKLANMEFLKGMLKSYIKLYLKQQETFISIAQIKLSE